MKMLASAAAFVALIFVAGQNQPPLAPRVPRTPAEALHAAVRTGNLDEVERLVSSGAPVDARDALGSTPLLDAAWLGKFEIAEFLIQHGADVNARHAEAGSTPLVYSVLTGRAHLVRLLLRSGAHVSGEYRDGQTLLHVAAARGNTEGLWICSSKARRIFKRWTPMATRH